MLIAFAIPVFHSISIIDSVARMPARARHVS